MNGAKKIIVIGAGLGGASAALSLAAEGYSVEVYEKNAHVGGKLNLLQRDGFSFDLGPSILTLPQFFEKLFTQHQRQMQDYVEIQRVSPHWRNFFEDGTVIDLYRDVAEIAARNESLEEQDIEELRRFLDYSRKLYQHSVEGYFDAGLDTAWQMIKYYGLRSTLKDFDLFATMDKGVERYLKNPYLHDIMNFFIKYVGSSPYDAPAVLNLLPHVQFEYGLWYVKGGMFELAKALQKLMQDVGVALFLETEVTGLLKEGRRIEGVRLQDGTTRNADLFVCNMEVVPAYRDLLQEDRRFLKKFDKFEPACSGLVLHLGTDREYPQLAHHNFFYSQNPAEHFATVFRHKKLPEDPTIYLVAPAKTDPGQAPKGCENLKILPHIPYLQEPPFPPEAYRKLREDVLDKLERMGLEDLRRHIIVEEMWTPEDIQKRYYSNRGAIYGVVSDRKKNRGFKAPKKSSKYPNLYFVGGSVNPGGGMPMAVLSGQQVSRRVVQEESR